MNALLIKYDRCLWFVILPYFPMQLFRKSRQTLVFNKFKTCLKNSDTRKIQYCSI